VRCPRRLLVVETAKLGEAFENDDGDLARGGAFVVGEEGHLGGLLAEETVAFFALGNDGAGLEGVAGEFDGDGGVSDEVVVPVGIGRFAAFRSDDDDAVVVGCVEQGNGVGETGVGAGGGQQQNGAVGVAAGESTAGGAELLDDPAVVGVPVAHDVPQMAESERERWAAQGVGPVKGYLAPVDESIGMGGWLYGRVVRFSSL
jgi:hypothetical protein